MRSSFALLTFASFLALSCSYSGGGGDGGTGDDGPGTDRAADGGGRPDYDPSGSLLLVIPEGTIMCSGFSEGRNEADELAVLSTMELAPGYYVLDRDNGTTQAPGFIQRIVFGPDQTVAEPTASTGTLEAVYHNWSTWEDWTYILTVPMLLDGAPTEADFTFHVSAENGAWPEEVRLDQLDPLWWATGEFRFAPQQVQRYALSQLPDPPVRDITATGANGDQIKLVVRQGPYYESCLCSGETACLFLTLAELNLGDYTATVDDCQRLVYVGSHHNWHDQYLVLLDPPATDVHAVRIIAPDVFTQPTLDPEFVYLDSSMNELRRESNVTWQE
jgi:hypothetical protein